MLLAPLDIWIEPSSLPAWGGDVSWIEHQAFEAIRQFRAIFHPFGRRLNSRESLCVQAGEHRDDF